MENAHIKDAAALCCFFAWLEKEVESQRTVTEISAADKLAGFRAEQADFVGLIGFECRYENKIFPFLTMNMIQQFFLNM